MRICFVSRRYWPAVSGMSAYAENLLRHLVADGHEVTLVSQYRGDPEGRAVYGGGPPPADRVPAGVRVAAVEALGEQAVTRGRPADFEADVAALRDAVLDCHRRAPLDVVHAQYGYPTGLAALDASALTGVPAVVSVQGGDGHWVGTCCDDHRVAIRRVFREAPALLIGSPSFAREVAARHDLPPGRFTVVDGATDTRLFHPRPDRTPGDLGDPPVLLYHGRMDRRKGVFDLLEAVRLLAARGRRLRLAMSGAGPDLEAVRELARTTGPSGLVEVTGPVPYDRAPAVYRGGDLFVSPTWAEGFSNTILEAMATGLPVVSTRVVGVVDCVEDGVNGLLTDARDPAGLADAVDRLLADGSLRTRLAATALEHVRTRWSWPVAAARITDVYRSVTVPGTARDTRSTGSTGGAVASAPEGDDPGGLRQARAAAGSVCRFRLAPHLL
ncbi:glycosyltransferase family 4 protein [Streptomyces sp. NPDC058459]|uniref:glycosyltransferase family 4 protein n=1 Tax=Streptomyces sp. NPDC058459 TaxID=3346508 RepID=UPI0036698D49